MEEVGKCERVLEYVSALVQQSCWCFNHVGPVPSDDWDDVARL